MREVYNTQSKAWKAAPLLRKLLILCFLFCNGAHAQIQWGETPVTLSTPGVNASQQQIAMDPMGNTTAVWVENGIVVSNSLPYGGSWGVGSAILSQSGASEPQIVVDAAGNNTAIWVEGGVIKSSVHPLGGSWSPSVAVSRAGASSPSLAIDGSGNVVAVWVEGGIVKSSTQLSGQGWQETPDTLSTTGASFPQIAVGAGGAAVAVWQAEVSAVNTIYSASKTIGGTWSPAQIISTSSVNSAYPRVAVDRSGNAAAAWFTYSMLGSFYVNVTPHIVYRTVGADWDTPFSLQESGLKNPVDLVMNLEFTNTGVAVLVWSNSLDGSLFNLSGIALPFGGLWSQTTAIDLSNLLGYSFDSVLSEDDLVVVWMHYNSGTQTLQLLSSVSGVENGIFYWEAPVQVTQDGPNGYPVLEGKEVGGNLYAAALWLSSNGGVNVVQANTGLLPEIDPPSNFAVQAGVQDFGVVQEHYNLLTWDPSPSPLTVGYRLYRNGVFVVEVSANVLQIVDYNQSPGVDTTYRLVAINNAGIQSSSATVHGP